MTLGKVAEVAGQRGDEVAADLDALWRSYGRKRRRSRVASFSSVRKMGKGRLWRPENRLEDGRRMAGGRWNTWEKVGRAVEACRSAEGGEEWAAILQEGAENSWQQRWRRRPAMRAVLAAMAGTEVATTTRGCCPLRRQQGRQVAATWQQQSGEVAGGFRSGDAQGRRGFRRAAGCPVMGGGRREVFRQRGGVGRALQQRFAAKEKVQGSGVRGGSMRRQSSETITARKMRVAARRAAIRCRSGGVCEREEDL